MSGLESFGRTPLSKPEPSNRDIALAKFHEHALPGVVEPSYPDIANKAREIFLERIEALRAAGAADPVSEASLETVWPLQEYIEEQYPDERMARVTDSTVRSLLGNFADTPFQSHPEDSVS